MNIPLYLSGWTILLMWTDHPVAAVVCATFALLSALHDIGRRQSGQ